MFDTLTIIQLKKIVRDYNLHNSIKGFSKMKKPELISKIKEHMKYEDKVLKRLNNNYMFDLKKNSILVGNDKKIFNTMKSRLKNLDDEMVEYSKTGAIFRMKQDGKTKGDIMKEKKKFVRAYKKIGTQIKKKLGDENVPLFSKEIRSFNVKKKAIANRLKTVFA